MSNSTNNSTDPTNSTDSTTDCSILNGFTVFQDYSFLNYTNPNDPYAGQVCEVGYQCAEQKLNDRYIGAPGACEYCQEFQWCLSGSISLIENAGRSNMCPDGYLCEGDTATMCPEGTICSLNRIMNCSDAASKSIMSELLVGTYCSSGSGVLELCPVGSYCPSQEEIKDCPSGYFCMRKSEEKWLDCNACDKGEEEIQRDPKLLVFILLVLFHIGLFLGFRYLVDKGYLPEECARPLKSLVTYILELCGCDKEEESLDNQRYEDSKEEKEKLMEEIATSYPFQSVDVDLKGVVTCDDIQKVLKLSDKMFSRLKFMLSLSSVENFNKEKYDEFFPEAMLSAQNMEPSEQDVRELFSILDYKKNGYVTSNDMYGSCLQQFLLESEVNALISKFRDLNPSESRKVKITETVFVANYSTFLNEITSSLYQTGTSMVFQELSLDVMTNTGETKRILRKVNGEIRPKQMTAILGGSGAGKTSLLSSLCGRAFYGTVGGRIYVNGHEGALAQIKDSLGFVPQDDIVYAELTVRENFMFSGRFRLPVETSDQEIEDLVDETVANLGLKRCENTIVGDVKRRGVSGGEKKRVNIGLELMGKPEIIFMDEPTSGLDSSSSAVVMQALRLMTVKNHITICCVIHQPRKFVFEQFDNVIVLGFGGYVAYAGPTNEVEMYFQSLGFQLPPGENIADFLLDAVSGLITPTIKDVRKSGLALDFEREWIQRSAQDEESGTDSVMTPSDLPDSPNKPNFFGQLKLQWQRRLLVINRTFGDHVYAFFVILIGMVIMTLLVGILDPVEEEADVEENCYPGVLTFDQLYSTVMQPLNTSESDENFTQYQLCNFIRNRKDVPYMIENLSGYAQNTNSDMISFVLQMGIVGTLCIGIVAAAPIGDHLLEFRRESGSGYNVAAFYLAVSSIFVIENMIMMTFISLVIMLLRVTIASKGAFILNFIILGLACGSWGFFYSTWINPESAVLTVGLHAILGSFVSGASKGCDYEQIYDSDFINILSGLISPARYFGETYQINEYACLKHQAGFSSLFLYLFDATNYDQLFLGENDPNVAERTCDGWYWNFWPSVFAGITIHYLSGMILNYNNREMMYMPSFKKSIKDRKFLITFLLALAGLIFLFTMTASLTLSTRGKLHDDLDKTNVFCDLVKGGVPKAECEDLYDELKDMGYFKDDYDEQLELPDFCQNWTAVAHENNNVFSSSFSKIEL